MLKLIKYEYRKDLVLYIIMFAVLFALEAYTLFAILSGQEAHLFISLTLFILGALSGILFIMIMGAVSYGRELNSKYSYMTFMTPQSPYKIVGSKYISLFVATILASVVYVLFIYIDIKLIINKYKDIKELTESLNIFFKIVGIDASSAIFVLLADLFVEWIYIFSVISCAYLGITFSATVLSNKKGKGWLSFAFFLVIFIATRIIITHLPKFDFGTSLWHTITGSWLTYVFEIILIAASYIVSSKLIDKKVSL